MAQVYTHSTAPQPRLPRISAKAVSTVIPGANGINPENRIPGTEYRSFTLGHATSSVNRFYGYNGHEHPMRTVNVAELKNRLSAYLGHVKNGDVIIVRDRNLPVAKLVPFAATGASDEELLLVARGAIRLPDQPLDLKALDAMPRPSVKGRRAMQAVIAERGESR